MLIGYFNISYCMGIGFHKFLNGKKTISILVVKEFYLRPKPKVDFLFSFYGVILFFILSECKYTMCFQTSGVQIT